MIIINDELPDMPYISRKEPDRYGDIPANPETSKEQT